jgi:hypothetical protein
MLPPIPDELAHTQAGENGHSDSSSVTLPPISLPFGNWK